MGNKPVPKTRLILLSLVAFITGTVIIYRTLTKNVDISQSKDIVINNSSSLPNQAIIGTYTDGTYTSVGNYISPGGEEQIKVVLDLRDGIVIDVQLDPLAERPTSVFFQRRFESAYKELVVGKSIDEVSLDVVAGSSLTPIGFNDALQKIRDMARS